MNKAKVQKNVRNLRKIKEIIEISKFDTLNKLQAATKISDSYLEMALTAKELITFAKKNYRVKAKENKVKSNNTLWVYITPDSELMGMSNSKFEKMILSGFNKSEDLMIAIGDSAEKFAKKNSLNLQYSSRKSSGLEDAVSQSINSSVRVGNIKEVKFIINSPKIKDKPLIIYPLSKFDIEIKGRKTQINKKYKFYPTISESLDSLTQIYISRVVFSLMKESQYFHLKEKLIRHEGSIKNVDTKIAEKISDLNKLNRKKETEELILVSQIAKRGGKHE